ncbi:hypothetical protein TWF192_005373 [Orbilia oligospora]|uniref:Uncharacterized protein n=1 Tax=Orbilia oligospora TaxID=2813651 RepID=A0A6G1MAT0_ORBOL|nr:hypothetical protein TWF679_004492 [Orbilia oligospora]KAF3250353.1 hypothetical protein TWF192_005373 [Orbilia oligospora]
MTDVSYDFGSTSSSERRPQGNEFSHLAEQNSIDFESFNYTNLSNGRESAIQSDLWAVEDMMSDLVIESGFQLARVEAAPDTKHNDEDKIRQQKKVSLFEMNNDGASTLGVIFTAQRLGVPILDFTDIDDLSENPIGSGASAQVYSGKLKGRLVAVKYFLSDPGTLKRRKGKAPLRGGENKTKISVPKKYSSYAQQQMNSVIEEMTMMAHAGMQPQPNIAELLGIGIREIEPTPQGDNALFDSEASNVQIALFMELADTTTPTLAHWIEGGFVAPENVGAKALILSDIINGILTLHERHITHGDIKPENILIFSTLERPVAKVSDFGLSDVRFRSMRKVAGGTELWAAPEVKLESFDKEWAGSQQRDVYSFGLVAYYTLLGRNHSMHFIDEETLEETPLHIDLPRHLRNSYWLRGSEKYRDLDPGENEDANTLRMQIQALMLLESWQRPETKDYFDYLNSETVSTLHAAMIQVVWPGRMQERNQRIGDVVIGSDFWLSNVQGVVIVDLALKAGFLEWEISGIGKDSPADKEEPKANIGFISAGIYALNACLEPDPEKRPSMQQLKDILHVQETGKPKWLNPDSKGISIPRKHSTDDQPFQYKAKSAPAPLESLGSFLDAWIRLMPLIESEIESYDSLVDRFRAYSVCFTAASKSPNHPKTKYYHQYLMEHNNKINWDSFSALYILWLSHQHSHENHDSDTPKTELIKVKTDLQQITANVLPIDFDEISDAFQHACKDTPQPVVAYKDLVDRTLKQYLGRGLGRYKPCRVDTPGIVASLTQGFSKKVSEIKKRIQQALSSNDEMMARDIQRTLQKERSELSEDDIAYLTLYAAEECSREQLIPRCRLLSIMVGSDIEEYINKSEIMQLAFESHSIQSHHTIRGLFLRSLRNWSVILQPKVLALTILYDIDVVGDSLLKTLQFEISLGSWTPKDPDAMAKVISTPVNLNSPHYALAVTRSRKSPCLTWAESFPLLHISVMVDNVRTFQALLTEIDPIEINAFASGSFHLLHLAALRRNPFVIARLLISDPRFQVDPDVRVKGPSLGYTPLHLLTRFGVMYIINTLVLPSGEGDIRTTGKDEAETGRALRLSCISILLKHSRNPDTQDWEGLSPFHVYIQRGDLHAARMLLSDTRVNPCLKNFQGNSVLHIAAKPAITWEEDEANAEDPLALLKFCLEYPAIRALVNEKNHVGMTPLALAVINDEFERVEHFVAAGADITCRDVFGTSILQNLVGKNGPTAGLRLIWELLRLEDLGIGVTRDKIRDLCRNIDNCGRNILHYACSCIHIEIPSGDSYDTPSQCLEAFIDLVLHLADDDSGLLGHCDHNGLLPTDLATFAGYEEIAENLIREYGHGPSEGAETMRSMAMEVLTDAETFLAQQDHLKTILNFQMRHDHGSLNIFTNLVYDTRDPTDDIVMKAVLFVGSAIMFMSSNFPETIERVDALDLEARMKVLEFRGKEGERDYGPRFFELSGVEDTGPLRVDPNAKCLASEIRSPKSKPPLVN